ncbi:MAG: hypothetical protein FJ284_14030 [Planctomycetes bacterium]|nr:hypothetical protein [Planctomycetota bacterium]MBM4059417.1 hypothetical protein [Planctomycetota bacterium]
MTQASVRGFFSTLCPGVPADGPAGHRWLAALVMLVVPWWARSGLGQTPAPVVAARVSTMPLAGGQSFVGTVLPARTSDVGSAVDGRLVSVLSNRGWPAGG